MKGRKLRSACDVCHKARVKCTGGQPCSRCGRSAQRCLYSYSQRNGRLRAPIRRSATPTLVSDASERRTAADDFSAVVHTVDSLDLGDVSVELFDSVWPDFSDGALELTASDFNFQDVPPVPSTLNESTSLDSPEDLMTRKEPCTCRAGTLKCLSLLDDSGVATTRLDTVLAEASDVFQHVQSIKSCDVCSSFAVQSTLSIYLLQHIADNFCNVARNPQAFFAGVPQLKLGSLSLSPELDTRHKTNIVLGTLDAFRQVVQGVVTTTKSNPVLEKDALGIATPPQPTAVMNARFLLSSAQHLQKRVQLIKEVFENSTVAL